MIIEEITVTTTPTPLYDLLAVTGRDMPSTPTVSACSLRAIDSVVIMGSDPLSVRPVVFCDPANGQPFESHMTMNLYQTLLSVDSGTAKVGVVISD